MGFGKVPRRCGEYARGDRLQFRPPTGREGATELRVSKEPPKYKSFGASDRDSWNQHICTSLPVVVPGRGAVGRARAR
jgi:hypothetical protein